MIADKETHKLLGMQVAGPGEVDKMADIAVVGISAGLKAEDFIMMDFAYAPPFSTAIHPFATACGVLCNKLFRRLESFTPAEYMAGAAKGYRIVDLLPAPTLTGFDWLDMTKPETAEGKFKKDEKLLLVCSRGKRAYLTREQAPRPRLHEHPGAGRRCDRQRHQAHSPFRRQAPGGGNQAPQGPRMSPGQAV